jgi:hypothetical protein
MVNTELRTASCVRWIGLAMIEIQEYEAQLDDENDLAHLLESIPYPSSVRAMLARTFFGRRWDANQNCDTWLASDGKRVVCLKIRGVTAKQIAAIRFSFDELQSRDAGLQLSRNLISDLAEHVTDDG